MKIILLNPWIDAQHEIAKTLQARGVALLLPADAAEAWQMLQLHGTSVDLAILHREGRDGEPGSAMDLLKKLKGDPTQEDLPYILTSEKWSDVDCASHQATPLGANAYLIQPFLIEKLIDLIEAVTGQKLASAAVSLTPAPSSPPKKGPPVKKMPASPQKNPKMEHGPILEDASEIFTANQSYEPTTASIRLEMPEAAQVPEANAQPAEIQVSSVEPVGIEIGVAAVTDVPRLESSQSMQALDLSLPTASDLEVPSDAYVGTDLSSAELMPSLGSDELAVLPDDAPSPPEPSLAVAEFTGFNASETLVDEPDTGAIETAMAQEMPYLFKDRVENALSQDMRMVFAQPVGDAVVPGGAAHSPDLETLKKFLLLREQDVSALSIQLRSAREQVAALEEELRVERIKNGGLTHKVEEQIRRIEAFEREKEDALLGLRAEVDELTFKLKVKTDKAKILESKVRSVTEETERLKERVRMDIRKIRVREKELENRLEILKKDSEVLITARENKVIELKRKLDLLEFNMDLLQDQYAREKETNAGLREKLSRAAQAMRVAGGVLDSGDDTADQEAS